MRERVPALTFPPAPAQPRIAAMKPVDRLSLARAAALIAVAELGVHQLRYLLAFGGAAGDQLAHQGHSYLGAAAPVLERSRCRRSRPGCCGRRCAGGQPGGATLRRRARCSRSRSSPSTAARSSPRVLCHRATRPARRRSWRTAACWRCRSRSSSARSARCSTAASRASSDSSRRDGGSGASGPGPPAHPRPPLSRPADPRRLAARLRAGAAPASAPFLAGALAAAPAAAKACAARARARTRSVEMQSNN